MDTTATPHTATTVTERQSGCIARIREIYHRLEPDGQFEVFHTMIQATISSAHGRGVALMWVHRSKITATAILAGRIETGYLDAVQEKIDRMNESLPLSAAYGLSHIDNGPVFAAELRPRRSDPASDARLEDFCTELFRTAPDRLGEIAVLAKES